VAEQRIRAAIDVGSNSVHLLVAAIEGDELRTLHDESELLGLGEVVDRARALPDEQQEQLAALLERYVAVARGLGATTVHVVATEPLRRASNGEQVADGLGRRLGLPMRILPETLEGRLTYFGATAGTRSAHARAVIDIGGGSTEVILAVPGARLEVTSLPTGSSRLSPQPLPDPPSRADIEKLRQLARRAVGSLAPARPAEALFVAGTATNLARLGPLTQQGLTEVFGLLAELGATQLSERYGINLRRAGQLPAGAALVDALLRHFGLEQAHFSDASLRDGAILAAERLGDGWPERLPGHLDAAQLG
jgi:exopolyphosphatase/pppGpp-phosphohydrolase